MSNPIVITLRHVAVGLVLLAAFASGAGAQGYAEGKEYLRLRNPMPVETGKNIEVDRILLLRLPALRGVRAVPADTG